MRFDDSLNTVGSTMGAVSPEGMSFNEYTQNFINTTLKSISDSAKETYNELQNKFGEAVNNVVTAVEKHTSAIDFIRNTAEIKEALDELPESERGKVVLEWRMQLEQQRLAAEQAKAENAEPWSQQVSDWFEQAQNDVAESWGDITASVDKAAETSMGRMTDNWDKHMENLHDINTSSPFSDMPNMETMTAEDWAARAQMGAAYNWKKTADMAEEGAHAMVGAVGDMAGAVIDTVGAGVSSVLGETVGFADKDAGDAVKSSIDAVTGSVSKGLSGITNAETMEDLEKMGDDIADGYQQTADDWKGVWNKAWANAHEAAENDKAWQETQKGQIMDIIDSHRPETLPGYEFLSEQAGTEIGQEVIQNNLNTRISSIELSQATKAFSDMRDHNVSENTINEMKEAFAATATFNDPATAHSTRVQMIVAMNTFNENMKSRTWRDYNNGLSDKFNPQVLQTQLGEIYNAGLKQDLEVGNDMAMKTTQVLGDNLDLYHEAQITEVNNLINMQDNTPVGNLSYEQQCTQLQQALDNYDKVAKEGDVIALGGPTNVLSIQVDNQKGQNVYSIDGGETFMSKNELMCQLQVEQFKNNLTQFSAVYQPPSQDVLTTEGSRGDAIWLGPEKTEGVISHNNSENFPNAFEITMGAGQDNTLSLVIDDKGTFRMGSSRQEGAQAVGVTQDPAQVVQAFQHDIIQNTTEQYAAASQKTITREANKTFDSLIADCNALFDSELQEAMPDRTNNLLTGITKQLEVKTAENQKEIFADLAKTTKDTMSR